MIMAQTGYFCRTKSWFSARMLKIREASAKAGNPAVLRMDQRYGPRAMRLIAATAADGVLGGIMGLTGIILRTVLLVLRD